MPTNRYRRRAARQVGQLACLLMLAVALVACGSALSATSGGAPASEADDMAAADFAEAPAREAADTAGEVAGGANGLVAQQAAGSERKLVFTGRLQLQVDEVPAFMDEARQWVEARGGFVESSTVSGPERQRDGRMTLRVPRDDYEAARAHLRDAAVAVLADESEREDVTARYVDLSARLENLRAAETELRALMTEVRQTGGDAEDILAIYRELTDVRSQIESLQAQLDALSEQVALSTLNVFLTAVPPAPGALSDAWRPGRVFQEAVSDLVGGLQTIINGAIYLAVAVLPQVALVLGVVGLIVLVLLRGGRWVYTRLKPGNGA